jgi:superfamily II RNA helicase
VTWGGLAPGSIIRTVKRLEELLRQMCAAAKAIGNTELENKFAEGTASPRVRLCACVRLYVCTYGCMHGWVWLTLGVAGINKIKRDIIFAASLYL